MWEILQSDLRHCLQNLNQTLISWQKNAPEAKSVAEIINQLQKLVAGGLLLQANDLVSLIKKSQIFIEERSLQQTPLSEKDIDVLHQLSLILDQLAKSENPQQEYQLGQQNINNLSKKITENLSEQEQKKDNEGTNLSKTSSSSVSEKQTEQLSTEKNTSNINIVEIFHKELQIGINLLIECVLKIEQGSARLNDYKEMMRCAHSLKGGARLAGLNNVVTLAHNLEDIFTKVQNGEHSFKSDDIDILMQLIDMLLPLATLEEENSLTKINQLLDKSKQLFKALLANKSQSIQQKSKKHAQQHNEPAGINEPIQEVVSVSHFSGSEEYLQRIINIASDMKIDSQLSLEIMNDFRRLYRELSIFGNDLNELQQGSTFDKDTKQSSDDDTFSEKTELQKSFRQTMQHYNELFEKLDLSDVEHRNKVNQLSKSALNCRMGPFANCLTGLTRLVRDLSKKQQKSVHLNILGEKTPIDRDILEELAPVLIHLVQNSIDHGIAMPAQRIKQNKKEQATLTICAQHRSGYLIINVKDDGNGIDLDKIRKKIVERNMVANETVNKLSDEELLSFIFLPQFTLKKEVTQVSGRGVGLDVVHNFITKFNGKLKVDNQLGKGIDFEFRLPLSMATLRCVILRIEQELYAIPVNRIEQVLPLSLDKVYYVEGKAAFRLYDKDIYLFNGKQALGLDGVDEESPSTIVLLKSERNYFGFMVNEIINELELVDRPLPQALGKLRDVRTASALPDGRPIIILDVEDLVTNMEKMHLSTKISGHNEQKSNNNKQILVVDDSLTIREVQRNMLEAHGYSVDVAIDGIDGWNHLRQNNYQLLITDIDMPRLNGWELLDKVKNHSVLSHLPVIIVSYKDNPGDFERGLQAGADSYISKGSFQDNSFIQTVNDLLGYSTSHE